ncbi:MAG: REJ domain-containing protein [Desulfomonilia bacterium]|nr:REJ domain-containing protein [Desulfomonilia bacterium]
MRRFCKICMMVLALLILFPLPGITAQLLVSWNANSEDDLGGYKVYYGTHSRTYGPAVDVGNVLSCEISGLSSGNTYYVAVTAYDSSGNESDYSQEVDAYITVPDDTPPTGSVIVNSGELVTPTRVVSLTLSATDNSGSVAGMKFSNDNETFSAESAYASSAQWVLTEGDGSKTVFVRFKDAAGNWSTSASDTIELRLDSDGDGIPDAWERLHGLDPSDPHDAAYDSDQDGISNLEEYVAGTDPMDPSDNIPVAVAGLDQTSPPTRITLDGSASWDPNNDPLHFTWSQKTGPIQVTIENPNAHSASFVGVKAGVYEFMLTCYDGKASSSDSLQVTILNVAPTVDAGPDMTVEAGAEVVLHATGSDPNGDALTYQWTKVEGPNLALPEMNLQDIRLTMLEQGLYRFSVLCSDGKLSSASDEVCVTVNAINRAPTADAGLDRDVYVGTTVYLDGTNSFDPDDDPLEFIWTQVDGEQVILGDSATAQPWFETSSIGTKVFELRVSDGIITSTPDSVTIRILGINTAPTADAGQDIHAFVGDEVVLDATGSFDPDGDSLTFVWTQISGATVELARRDTPQPFFTPTTSGVLEFSVSVSDGEVSSMDRVLVTVEDVNQVPIADAGDTIVALVGETVILDGRLSYDPDGDPLSFLWSQLEGTRVSLNSPNSACPSFVAEMPGKYVFELRVYDGTDTSIPASVEVIVEEEAAAVVLQYPESDSVVSSYPTFSWDGYDMNKYKLYLSINSGKFNHVYSGRNESYTLHPVLWRWFIPSGSTLRWYVEGYSKDSVESSEIWRFKKK